MLPHLPKGAFALGGGVSNLYSDPQEGLASWPQSGPQSGRPCHLKIWVVGFRVAQPKAPAAELPCRGAPVPAPCGEGLRLLPVFLAPVGGGITCCQEGQRHPGLVRTLPPASRVTLGK